MRVPPNTLITGEFVQYFYNWRIRAMRPTIQAIWCVRDAIHIDSDAWGNVSTEKFTQWINLSSFYFNSFDRKPKVFVLNEK